jgi:hypothetical protein
MSSYVKSTLSTEEIFWIEELGDVIRELQIARVYWRNALIYEYANSNFFSSDKFVIVTKDKYVFNGKKINNN